MSSHRSIERVGSTAGRVLVLLPGYADRPERLLDRVDEFDPDGRWTVVALEPIRSMDAGPSWYEVTGKKFSSQHGSVPSSSAGSSGSG